jgi:hypothetical protein
VLNHQTHDKNEKKNGSIYRQKKIHQELTLRRRRRRRMGKSYLERRRGRRRGKRKRLLNGRERMWSV